nr:integrase, catalytic region, zinc finger, CCHC-type, peptidase aspartic, catalytic [Tanacetum cinerariifolium]
VIQKTDAIGFRDSEETLLLEDTRRSKMLKKHKDPMMSEKKAVEQHYVEKNKFLDKMKNVLKDNERLLEQAISADIVNIVVHDNVNYASQSQEKDTVIMKLKERLKSLSGNVKEEKIKKELEEIKTINIELDHRVTKLVAENEHLKQTYKQLYDSIKSSRVRSKEQSLKDTLSKIKGKAVVNEAVPLHSIDPELLKIDVAPLAPKLRNNRTAHTDYLRHTQEETATLKEIVESERLLNPLNTSLDYACKYTKHIQDLLIILKQTCPCINDLGTKLMAVTLKNNNKKIRFTEHIPSSGNTPVKTTSSANVVSTTPVLSSTGVNLLSSTSGSQPQGNTRKDRIQQIQSKAKKNKCSHHMTGDRFQLINFVHKFLGMVKFENDHVAKIMGYGDYKIGNVTISKVYFVEGLGHNLFYVGQFCDSDVEVAFCQHTCFIRNLDGVDLLTGSRGNNLYTLSLQDMMASSPICLLSKASKTKSWLWHRRISHLNFGVINHLARQGLVRVRLKVPVRHIRTDNGTEFVNQTLREYYEDVVISIETSVARSPQQNDVVERCNRTLIKAARTIVDHQAPKVIAPIVEVIPPVKADSIGLP